jgi:N-acetylneuraminate synthase/sialic acid synthase
MIHAAKYAGASAVKFQKRDNDSLYTKALLEQPYENPQSCGKTYGEHRNNLEFNFEQYQELIEFSKDIQIPFFATAFDVTSLKFLLNLKIDAIKIASADLINTPLIDECVKANVLVFLSCGGGSYEDVDRAYARFPDKNNVVLLHCTAAYPAPIDQLHLNVIPEFIKRYQCAGIGLSDHENGIDAASVAYMLGARVFEKHFTTDRSLKGSDQSFSLEPEGLKRMVRNLARIELMRGSCEKKFQECEKKPLNKMAKSIVAIAPILKGQPIRRGDLALKSPSNGLPPYLLEDIVGKIAPENFGIDDYVYAEGFEIKNDVG